ncbi:hypothetical protein H6P81_000278 [Aristolochia fimbriata]|uniref:Uncharacterized protein n=1 Tax=Aristolochia fimbriata TaxID=158543 RepID=A0AAV7F642_ARIFI|nr:hypothetical protein H6P81_000278 [Aristolochia fimbriata]
MTYLKCSCGITEPLCQVSLRHRRSSTSTNHWVPYHGRYYIVESVIYGCSLNRNSNGFVHKLVGEGVGEGILCELAKDSRPLYTTKDENV